MDWLALDFGPQFGDNFRGLLFLKLLAAKHPEARLHLWTTPQLHQDLGGLIEELGFIHRFLVHPRSPRQSYEINFGIIKALKARGLPFTLEHFPPGRGPDGREYHKLIPTAEPWFSAKLLAGEPLEAPDPVNQGEFLAGMLGLNEGELGAALPLFGRRREEDVGDYVCLGPCRPDPADPKQPARELIERLWEVVLASGVEAVALDRQDWFPPPVSPRVRDLRAGAWEEKVGLLNRARLFIGLDGGLNHFAAACGCPTLSFYGSLPGAEPGLLVGPYPRRTPFGRHRFFSRFGDYLAAVGEALGKIASGGYSKDS